MSAYTSQGWSANGSAVYTGDPRGSHEVERRPEGSGDFGVRQNGRGHMKDFHDRDSPPNNYNRSHGDRHYRYSSSPPPERGQYYPSERAKYHYNGHPPQRSSLLPLQRPLPRHRHSHNNVPYAWYRERRQPYVYDERNRGPILSSPVLTGSEHHRSPILPPPVITGPEHHHGYNGGNYYPIPQQNLALPPHSFRDPRMNRKSVSDGASNQFKSQYQSLLFQIYREHSYCDKTSTGGRNSTCMECESTLPRTLLSVVPKKILRQASEPSPPRQVTTPKPVKVQLPVRISHWPVVSNHSVENFAMDLGEDIDSGVDSATDEERKVKADVTTEEIVPAVRKPFHLPSGCWRLSPVLNKILEHPQEDDVQSQEKPIVNQQVQPMRIGNLDKKQQSEVKKKYKRRVKRRFTAKIDKKKKNQNQKSSMNNGVPAEIKLLLSGDFTPEILTSRSRAESFALARREVMEKEIEVHERERIQTARKGTDTDDSGVPNGVLNLNCTTDTSSEYSAAMTTSSSQSISLDQGSSSHDLDSGLQDLDSSVQDTISVLSSDSLLDEFPPEVVARCKKIAHDKSSGDTPLHKVCRRGKMDMVRCLLFYMKTDPNVADNAGWTPLHEACSNNRLVIANYLLKSGADANASARDGTRPIHDAIDIGALDIVESLVQHGADPTAELGDKTPLYLAKTTNHPQIYDYLLRKPCTMQ